MRGRSRVPNPPAIKIAFIVGLLYYKTVSRTLEEKIAGAEVRASTRIVGIFGDPVEHSLSPEMHNAAFRHLGLDWIYLAFHVRPAGLKAATEAIRALGLAGVNVTIPHKEAILPFLDELTPEAEKIGAVNTVIHHDGNLIGDNTDGAGFLKSISQEAGVRPAGKRCLLVGAGGVARAIGCALADSGAASLVLTNRTQSRAEALASHLRNSYPGLEVSVLPFDRRRIQEICPVVDMVLNATPVGVDASGEPVIPDTCLHPGMFVYDAVYHAATPLLMRAKTRGAQTLNGVGMLVYQGGLSFEKWTGRPAPVDVMRAAVLSRLK